MITWRYVGINDISNILKAVVLSELLLIILLFVPWEPILNIGIKGFPRSVFLIDGMLYMFFIIGVRVSKRLYLDILTKKKLKNRGKKTIIVGAGDSGENLIRSMFRNEFRDFWPVAFIDDDSIKRGSYIHGVKVEGSLNELKKTIVKYKAEAIIVAVSSMSYIELRKIHRVAMSFKIETLKIIPRIHDIKQTELSIRNLEDIKVEDIIRRQVLEIDYKGIENFLHNKIVLITGAGGSIGSEIATQICTFDPMKVVFFDIDETALHNLFLKIKRIYPKFASSSKSYFIVGDIRDIPRVEDVLKRFSPNIVFHAAAYKHVPMMEYNPYEAIKTNIIGTYNIVQACVEVKVKKFIMISTDKAVRPTSIMGATKRVAEEICSAFNSNENEFIAVRFGNVLGSRGSVLPLFLEQLRQGGPLTVTHKDIKRYFMTIPEAVSLVLQASAIGRGGDILVLDMGEPVKILDIAEDIIRIHGLEPYKDIDIEIVGLRPGEKLFEELLTAEEGTESSVHNKIYIARSNKKYNLNEIIMMIDEFKDLLNCKEKYQNDSDVKCILKKYVKYYE